VINHYIYLPRQCNVKSPYKACWNLLLLNYPVRKWNRSRMHFLTYDPFDCVVKHWLKIWAKDNYALTVLITFPIFRIMWKRSLKDWEDVISMGNDSTGICIAHVQFLPSTASFNVFKSVCNRIFISGNSMRSIMPCILRRYLVNYNIAVQLLPDFKWLTDQLQWVSIKSLQAMPRLSYHPYMTWVL